jgi:hypothetical protein
MAFTVKEIEPDKWGVYRDGVLVADFASEEAANNYAKLTSDAKGRFRSPFGR